MSLWNIGYIILGVYICQEYGQQLPSVKIQVDKLYTEFQKSVLF